MVDIENEGGLTMTKKRKRPNLRIIDHFMIVDGTKIKIDPSKTDLPDRCKMFLVEISKDENLAEK